MKMLTRNVDQKYLASIKKRLEINGIPAVIQGKETARMSYHKFLHEPTLWIYIDDQFEDAVKLMDNPDHSVTTGIDIGEFYELANSETVQKNALNAGLKQIAIYISAILIGMFVVIVVLERMSS
jgi:hypothetical protein